MTLYLLGKSTINKSEVIVIRQKTLYEYYEDLIKIFSHYCPEIRLAEPVITNDNHEDQLLISWYTDTVNEPVHYSDHQQQEIYQRLAQAIAILQTHFTKDSLEGQLIEAALSLSDRTDILIEKNWIILKGWGISFGEDEHKESIYLPSFVGLKETSQPITENNSPPTSPSVQDDLIQKKVNPSSFMAAQSTFFAPKKYNISLRAIIPRVVVALVFFTIGLLLGWRIIFAERPVKIEGLPVLSAQELVQRHPDYDKQNKILQNEIQQLENQLKHPPCDIKQTRADPSLNKSLDHPYTPLTSQGKNYQGSLPELLEKSTVFIMAMRDNGLSVASGTGFFITPDMIVTNRHVIENAQDNKVIVTNKALGQLKIAHIVSMSQSARVGGLDLAVLKIEQAPPQQPLSFSLQAQPLQDVIAAGYPGIMISQDNALKRLVKGDLKAIPGVILTKGQINAIQNNDEGEKIMPHSAMVSPGNSGGPLIDLCGRVVGVNSFVTMDQQTSSHGNYAQKSDTIVQVLQAAHIPIQVQSGTCQVNPSMNNNKEEKDNSVPNEKDLKNKPDASSLPMPTPEKEK